MLTFYISCIFIFGLLFSKTSFVSKLDENAISVALVQTNLKQQGKWDENRTATIENNLKEVLRSIPRTSLVVFPEMAIPAYLSEMSSITSTFQEYALDMDSLIVMGMATSDYAGKAYNSAIGIGNEMNIYNKQKLFPFWEYTPKNEWATIFGNMLGLSEFGYSQGVKNQEGFKIGRNELNGWISPVICYESFFPVW